MNHKDYNRLWMREKRSMMKSLKRRKKMLEQGRCIRCEIILALDPTHHCEKPIQSTDF